MNFVQIEFPIFMALVFGVYWLLRDRRWQNGLLVLASGVSVPPAPPPPPPAFSPPGSTFPSPVTPAKLCREGPQLVAGLFVLPTSLMAILRNPSGPAESQGWELSRPAKSRTLELKWLRNFKSIVYGQLIESFKDHFSLLVNCS